MSLAPIVEADEAPESSVVSSRKPRDALDLFTNFLIPAPNDEGAGLV